MPYKMEIKVPDSSFSIAGRQSLIAEYYVKPFFWRLAAGDNGAAITITGSVAEGVTKFADAATIQYRL
jgi:hypothetical protein